MDVSAEVLVVTQAIRGRIAAAAASISAYWYKVEGDRDEFADALREAFRQDPVVTLIVRTPRFDNPNAVLSDLADLIERNRSICEEALVPSLKGRDHCGLLLLGRSELGVTQASSPVEMPEWFPVEGGHTLSVMIEDLTWTAEAPLNTPDSRGDEIAAALFSLEGLLLARLARVHSEDHSKVNGLLSLFRASETETFQQILEKAQQFRESISTPQAFRPSVLQSSLIGRLWALVQRTPAEGLAPLSKALASGLDCQKTEPDAWHESLVSVLNRPSNLDAEPARRFARNLALTIAAACQFLTASAHADQYALYPVPLTRSLSLDLRRSIDGSEGVLLSLE